MKRVLKHESADIYELIDIAEKELDKRLSDDEFSDDWQWNDNCFQFVVCTGTNPRNIQISDPYRFYYRDDEETYGTAEEQLDEWLDEWFPISKRRRK